MGKRFQHIASDMRLSRHSVIVLSAAYSRISDVDTGTFKYFIKVVPTEYQGWTGGTFALFPKLPHCERFQCLLWLNSMPNCAQLQVQKPAVR